MTHGLISDSGTHQTGLEIYTTPGTNYGAGDYGEYLYVAPPGAYISRADFEGVEHTNASGTSSYVFDGIYNLSGLQWENETVDDDITNQFTYLGASPYDIGAARTYGGQYFVVGPPGTEQGTQGHLGNAAAFGLLVATPGARASQPLDVALFEGATIWLYDSIAPSITSAAPSNLNGGAWTDDGDQTYPVAPTASDSGVGVKYLSLGIINSLTSQVDSLQTAANPCTGDHTITGYCPASWSSAFSYTLPEGNDEVEIAAADALDNEAPAQTFTARIDRSPPTLALNGSLYQDSYSKSQAGPVLQGVSYPLDITAGDSYSGVAEIDITVDANTPNAKTTVYDGSCTTSPASQAGCDNNDEVQFIYNSGEYPAGVNTITVTAEDWLGTSLDGQPGLKSHTTTQTFSVDTQPPAALPNTTQSEGQSDTLGLEGFYDYRTIATGAGSKLNVNLGTGNAVWSWTPVTDPGQGLASFVELTYNSQQRLSDLDLLNLDNIFQTNKSTSFGYDQSGIGFSLGIDGLTRLNEPLDLSQLGSGQISFTDIDGTHHTFVLNPSTDQWMGPPGVFLHLRQWQTYDPAHPSTFNKVWAITRPDGVTFFFDDLGYESAIEDRVGNVITFTRDFVLPADLQQLLGGDLTAAVCTGPVTDYLNLDSSLTDVLGAGCAEQTQAVIDQNNRSIAISYYTGGDDAGNFKTITDHAGHVLQFTYDLQSGQYLDAVSLAGARTFKFGYGGSGDPQPVLSTVAAVLGDLGQDSTSATLFPQALTSISDPRLSGGDPSRTDTTPTTISYAVAPATGSDRCPAGQTGTGVTQAVSALLNLEPKCVTSVTARDGGTTGFVYTTGTDSSGNVTHTATVTAPQADQNSKLEVSTDTMDADFRPIVHVDPLGRETQTVWNNVGGALAQPCSQSNQQSQPANTIAQTTTGEIAAGSAGTASPVATLFCYDPNGELTEQQGPANIPPASRRTSATPRTPTRSRPGRRRCEPRPAPTTAVRS